MTAKNAVDWHTQIAANFDKKYSESRNFKERYAIWTKILDKYSNRDFSVLDVGCGSGVFTFYLADKNRSVTGIDASPEMLRICREKMENAGLRNVNFLNCNIQSMGQCLEGKADMIICSSVLEYIDDLNESLETIRQSMNKDGLFIFSMPNRRSVYRKLEPLAFNLVGRPKYYKYVKNVCTLHEIENKLKIHGFSILESEYYGETPFLSEVFRKLGQFHYSANLFVVVARLSS